MTRWAWADVDLGAVRHNVETLCAIASPAAVWAVVKANGYGHGAEQVARAALSAGADGLCVALVQEGVSLRDAGLECPILVLSEQPATELSAAVRARLDLTVYSHAQLEAIAVAGGRDHPVHLKIDTGMRRVGAAADEALGLAEAIARSPAVRLAGVCTHLAMADEPADPYTDVQIELFDDLLTALTVAGHHPPLVHAANSA
ncbi:MAG: alanine racemase, partial [Ilumatobacteraceae bacterium]